MRHLLAVVVLLIATLASAAEPRANDERIDRAIERALTFLAKNQDKVDGSWRGQGGGKNPAITSLAVMAFLSAGHVPGEGKYGEVLDRGIRNVLKSQQPNGLISDDGNHEMYHHGIATLMLAEVAGMCDGPLSDEIRRKLEKSVTIILKAQRKTNDAHRGGWRYRINALDSDISVTGWQIMALRAAKNVGCDVPPEAIERAVDYVKRCQDNGNGGFKYTPNEHVTVACTGTSVLALELCGRDQHRSPQVLKAGAYLISVNNLPNWKSAHFFYSIYYGSQATFQLGGNYWAVYRPRLHDLLLSNQDQAGSWTGSEYNGSFGVPYSTAMSVLALTVEYRYLPIYQRGEESNEKDK